MGRLWHGIIHGKGVGPEARLQVAKTFFSKLQVAESGRGQLQ